MKKFSVQNLIRLLGYIIAGSLALGGILGAVNDALSLITPAITFSGTFLIILIWLATQLWLRQHPIPWKTQDGKSIHVKRIALGITLPMMGMILLLWVPMVISNDDEDKQKLISTQVAIEETRVALLKEIATLESKPAYENVDATLTAAANQVAELKATISAADQRSGSSIFGNGYDGGLTVNPGQTIFTDSVRYSLVNDAVSGQNQIVIENTTGFNTGAELLLIQMSGLGTGSYEYAVVASMTEKTLSLQNNIINNYYTSGDSRAQVIRVPHYEYLSVLNGGTLTAHAWDGKTGGVLAAKVNSMATIQGILLAGGLGFHDRSGSSSTHDAWELESHIFLGLGGDLSASKIYNASNEGNGGGIIILAARVMTVPGAISANGANADIMHGQQNGGNGGSILLQSDFMDLGLNKVTAIGGEGIQSGNTGEIGKIRLLYCVLNGVTRPSAAVQQVDCTVGR